MPSNKDVAQTIKRVFSEIYLQQNGEEPPELEPDTVLLESGVDSLGFALMVVNLEDELGYDPFTRAVDAYYPTTFKEFVDFYVQHAPS